MWFAESYVKCCLRKLRQIRVREITENVVYEKLRNCGLEKLRQLWFTLHNVKLCSCVPLTGARKTSAFVF